MAERQQINLYQPVADLSSRPFSARAALLSVSAVLAAVVAIWGYGSWQVSQVQHAVTALQEQQRRQEDAVTAAGAMHAARANPEQLQAQIKELTAEIAIRRRALNLLRAGTEGQIVGFSGRLAGLARRHVDGLWIDHIVLSGSSDSMTLEGVALDPDLVPRYLRDLAQDSALTGARFDQLVIERPAARAAKGEVSADSPVSADSAVAPDSHAMPPNGMRFRAESNLPVSNLPVAAQHPGAAS